MNCPGRTVKTSREDIQYETYLGQFETSDQHELQLISNLGGKVEFIAGLFYWESENEQPLYAMVPGSDIFPTPVIAKINGYCIGGGLNLAACADFELHGFWKTLFRTVPSVGFAVDDHGQHAARTELGFEILDLFVDPMRFR